MTKRHISQTDLNLLLALDMLLQERNVTRAADRLALSQPAMSRILSRLRAAFQDPLFIRTSRGLKPTDKASALAAPLKETVAGFNRLLLEEVRFDPCNSRRRFHIAAVDYAQLTLLAPVLAKLRREAPLVEFEIRQPTVKSERDLAAGSLDLLITPWLPAAAGIISSRLYDDGYACVLWNKHPCRRLTAASFAAMEHVLVAPRERPGGIVDEILARHGLTRRIGVQLTTFLMVPHILIGTERIATVPLRMAKHLVRTHPLKVLTPPIAVPRFTLYAGWHEIHRNDPGHRWLRQKLCEPSAGVVN